MLKLDPVCEDAQFELVRVRVQILIDMGFTPSLSEQAVRTYSTVQQALEALLTGKSKLFLFLLFLKLTLVGKWTHFQSSREQEINPNKGVFVKGIEKSGLS